MVSGIVLVNTMEGSYTPTMISLSVTLRFLSGEDSFPTYNLGYVDLPNSCLVYTTTQYLRLLNSLYLLVSLCTR